MDNQENFRKTLGKHLKIKREELNLSQEKFAWDAGQYDKNLGKIERGVKGPSIQTLFKFRHTHNLSIDELLDDVKADLEREEGDD
ncbi:helix-turn-helix transcriptional regulator [Rossellomorea vietnamensis]|uniref:Helix-turn-helix transcriptional regulator n=1 Tax=Rossellomorea vietnamensis TaxID=218284 RepID=A0A5D4NWB6_9BACI|nr:helix-turn-helix transcriptional regulator [Rossellomorea vietnamensis]TYS17728.1 helix-turn-helix transcriptional regulator [Rossellomorea vietnamensis]